MKCITCSLQALIGKIFLYFIERSNDMSNMLKEAIGKALYSKRMEYGLTQEQMAAKCCISNRQYNDLENGKRLPGLRTFFNISIVCDLDVNEIIKDLISKGYQITDDKNTA